MKAVVYERFTGPMEVRSVPDPEPATDGVVIRVGATGLCRSDWHGWMGHDPDIKLPHVPGHEMAGIIEEVGPQVKKFFAPGTTEEFRVAFLDRNLGNAVPGCPVDRRRRQRDVERNVIVESCKCLQVGAYLIGHISVPGCSVTAHNYQVDLSLLHQKTSRIVDDHCVIAFNCGETTTGGLDTSLAMSWPELLAGVEAGLETGDVADQLFEEVLVGCGDVGGLGQVIGEVVEFIGHLAAFFDSVQLPRPGVPGGVAAHRVFAKGGKLLHVLEDALGMRIRLAGSVGFQQCLDDPVAPRRLATAEAMPKSHPWPSLAAAGDHIGKIDSIQGRLLLDLCARDGKQSRIEVR